MSKIKLNFQQQPKTPGYLSNFKAREGHKLVQIDLCLHPQSELLTKRGWVNVLEIKEDDYVWQVDAQSLTGSWCIPKQIIKFDYEGPMYWFGNIRGKFGVTENHKMLWIGQQTHKRKDKSLFRRISYSQEGIPTLGCQLAIASSHESYSDYSHEEIWKACMFQADGSYTKYNKYVISVAKLRKREMVRQLLGRDGSVHAARKNQNLDAESWSGIEFTSQLLNGKHFNLSTLGSNQVHQFIAALQFWDGNIGKSGEVNYTCTDKHNVDEVQAYLVRCGYEAKVTKSEINKRNSKWKDCYKVSIRKHKGVRMRPDMDFKKEDYKGLVGCVTVNTGFILIRSGGQTFVTGNCAVEPKVIAAFSRDENLLKLYGPDAKPNDVYLYNGAHIELFQDELRKYYDPYNPTVESINETKKQCKKIRSFCKQIVLAAGYGSSAKKLRSILITSGYPVTVKEAEIIHRDYWRLYKGIKDFEQQLRNIWTSTGGWVPSLAGKPICVPSDYLHDIVNRFAQTSGHEVLMMLVHEIDQLVRETGIEAHPWIPDFHDETIWEVREDQATVMVDIMNQAMDRVNERLDMDVKMSGEPQIADNLAEIKCEDYYEWKALQSRVV